MKLNLTWDGSQSNLATRRSWLKTAALSAGIAGLHFSSYGQNALDMRSMDHALEHAFMSGKRRLIVVRLVGGNDNLNTLVPFSDPLYRRYRPDIAVRPERLIKLNDELALNDALKGWAELYELGEAAILQEVGMPGLNLSHFESSDAWSRGGAPNEGSDKTGWIGKTFHYLPASMKSSFHADAVVLGGDGLSVSGPHVRRLHVQDGAALKALTEAEKIDLSSKSQVSSATSIRLANLINESTVIAQRVGARLSGENRFIRAMSSNYTLDETQQQIALLLWMVEKDVRSPFFQIDVDGFDMHGKLPGNHEARLRQAAKTIETLRLHLREMGRWDETLVLVHSEFGRRPVQNASMGTDHGTAGPAFLFGGEVKGGLIGQRADLAKLDPDGNIAYGIDFRCLYSSVLGKFWKLPSNPFEKNGFHPLDIIRS